MADPLAIAGLTIAILDQLLKLGERTATLMADFRDFDSDTQSLETRIRDENTRTLALRCLLFSRSAVYGGRTLFDQFDDDVQNQIQIFLEELVSVVDEAFQLLNRRKVPSRVPSPGVEVSSGPVNNFSRSSMSLQRWRWTLLDKKRVGSIINKFEELNSRIHGHIELICLGSELGVDLKHLQRMQNDENSKKLGFDVDAGLQIAAKNLEIPDKSLELCEESIFTSLQYTHKVEERFGVLQHDGRRLLVEYRKYAHHSPVSVDLDDRTRRLIDRLAGLLSQPKEILFRTPSCVGWIRNQSNNQVGFLFQTPYDSENEPLSLLRLLSLSGGPRPSLNQRLRLAHGLARCISQLQLVKWVHESFRSENILFFPNSTSPLEVDMTQPWILGFEYSRPESFFSSGHGDECLERDIYRHPDRQQNPNETFNKLHDIYALGVVLLEIGFWAPITKLDKREFREAASPTAIQNHLVRYAEKFLAQKMGERYQGIVLKCLRSEFEVTNDTKEDLKLQQLFRAQVVEVLEKAADFV